jgi:hypothetical protein
MTVLKGVCGVPASLAFLAMATAAVFAPAASAGPAFASDMILCVSDTGFGCFGGGGNSVSLLWDGSLSSSTTGTGTIISDQTINGDTGLTVDASLGSFTLNVSTGLFNPSPGTALDLNSVDVSSTGPGTLYVVFGAETYTGSGPFNEVGSVTLNSGVSSATNTACYEPGTGLFYICGQTPAPLIGSDTASTSGALDFTSLALAPGSPFGLEEDLTVAFSGAGTFSGDLSLASASVPEPATAGLIGLGLIAAGLVGRKKRNQAR